MKLNPEFNCCCAGAEGWPALKFNPEKRAVGGADAVVFA